MDKHYYIVRTNDTPADILAGRDYEVHFDSFEAAEDWANSHGCETIEEIEGSWDEYKKCWFCEGWYPVGELDREGLCGRCETAARDHGFDPDTRPYKRSY